jgi:hypothetical protein
MQVSKWGNSLAVRLPAALVKTLELKQGDWRRWKKFASCGVHFLPASNLIAKNCTSAETIRKHSRRYHDPQSFL